MYKSLFLLVFTSILLSLEIHSQDFISSLEQPLPVAISNNAVTGGMLDGVPHLFSFTGIDYRKNYRGIGLKSFRYNTTTQIWYTIPDVPDTRGKIAAGASTIDSIIYVIGGYHVDNRGNEVSSNKTHRYNINTNSYLIDGENIPVSIDDHVQAVWKDSLIFVITGWSNSGNIPNVQIYNPKLDTWSAGTSIPNSHSFKSFGASGTIVGNTIYYYGGASGASGFNCQNILRVGEIDPMNPSSISWNDSILDPSIYCYRAACVSTPAGINWLGGSAITYNYNGIAYNGSGGVPTSNQNIYYNPTDSTLNHKYIYGDSLPMDIRGIADFGNTKYLVGGMINNQEVTTKVWKLSFQLVGIKENKKKAFACFPNPTNDKLTLSFHSREQKKIAIINNLGQIVLTTKSIELTESLSLSSLTKGMYFIAVTYKNGENNIEKIIVK
ncbi:T9SS type A sorting domain-containing protein [Flavobacteriales bacterium]|nr:T9SS type A sorting domain-containing protein [Flavobacteriales bacterium]